MASWCAPRNGGAEDQHRYPRYFVTIGEKSVEKRFELFVKPQTGAYLCLASVPIEHNECVVTCPDHTYPCEGIEDEDSFVRVKVPFRVTVMPDKFATKEDLLMRSRTDDEGLQAFPVPLGRDETEELRKERLDPSELVDGELSDGPEEEEDQPQQEEEEEEEEEDYDPIADEMIGHDFSDGEGDAHHHHLFYSDDDSSEGEHSGSESDEECEHHRHFEPSHYRYFFGAEQQGGTVAMVKFGHTVDHDHNELALRFHSFRILVPWGDQADHFFQHEDVHALAEQNRIMHVTMEAAERLEDEPELLADELTELIGVNPVKKKKSSPMKRIKKVTSAFSRKKKSGARTSIFKNPASTSARTKKPSLSSRLKSKLPSRTKKAPKSQGQKMALAKGRPSNFSRAKQSVKARVNKVRGKKPAGSSSAAAATPKKPGRLSTLKQNVRQRVDTIRGKKPANKSAPPAKAATGGGGPKYDAGRASTSPGSVRTVTRDREKPAAGTFEEGRKAPKTKVQKERRPKKQTQEAGVRTKAPGEEEQKAPKTKVEKEKRPKKSKADGAAGGGGGGGAQQQAGGAAAGGGGGGGGGGDSKPSAPVATDEKQVAPAGVYKRSAGPPPRQFGYTGARQAAPAAQQSAPAYGSAAASAPSRQELAATPPPPARTQSKPTSSLPATPPQKAAASAAAAPAAKAPPRRFGDPRPPGQAAAQKPAAQEAAKPLPRRHGSDGKPVAQQKNPATGSSFKQSAKAGEKKPYWAQGAPGQPKPGEYGYGDTSGPALGTTKSSATGGLGPIAPKPPASSMPAAPQASSAPSFSSSSAASAAPSYASAPSSGAGFAPQQQQQQPTKIKIVNKTGGAGEEGRGGKPSKSSSSKASSSEASGEGKPSFSDRLKSKLPSKSSGDGSSSGGAAGGDSGGGGGGGGFGGAMLPMSQQQDPSQSGYAAQFQQQQQNAGFAGSGPGAQTGRMQGLNASNGNPLTNPPPGALAAPLAPGTLPPGTIMTTNGLMQLGPNGQFVPASQAQLAQMASAQGIQLSPQQQSMMGQTGNPSAPAAVPAQPGSSRPAAVDFGPNSTRVAEDDESLAAAGNVGPPRAGGRSSVATPASVGDELTADERLTRQERAFKTIIVMHENNFGKKPSAAQKERLRLRIASISPPFTMVKVIGQYMEWLIVDTGLRYQ